MEDKEFSASVHYRQAREQDRPHVSDIVRDTVAHVADLFRVNHGLEVFEIRPKVKWNKGSAAKFIITLSGFPDALPIYLGDDVTDEDAFLALDEGITVRIGRSSGTAARFHLEDQQSVDEFLKWLHDRKPQQRKPEETL